MLQQSQTYAVFRELNDHIKCNTDGDRRRNLENVETNDCDHHSCKRERHMPAVVRETKVVS